MHRAPRAVRWRPRCAPFLRAPPSAYTGGASAIPRCCQHASPTTTPNATGCGRWRRPASPSPSGASGRFPRSSRGLRPWRPSGSSPPPCYPPYADIILTALGMVPLLLPCGPQTRYQPTVAMLLAALDRAAGGADPCLSLQPHRHHDPARRFRGAGGVVRGQRGAADIRTSSTTAWTARRRGRDHRRHPARGGGDQTPSASTSSMTGWRTRLDGAAGGSHPARSSAWRVNPFISPRISPAVAAAAAYSTACPN